MSTRPRASTKQQAGLTTVACVAISIAVVLTVNANYQRRRADLLDENRKVASDYNALKALLESETDVASGLRDLQGKLRRYTLTVEDSAAIPTDMPGFQFIPVNEFEPSLIRSLSTLAEYTSCSLEGWNWEAGRGDGSTESAPESEPVAVTDDWRPFNDIADARRITLRVRGGWPNLQRFICGLSEFEVPIPDTSPTRFWPFPHVVVVNDLTIQAGQLPEGADPAEAPPLDCAIKATVFRFKPLTYRTPTGIPQPSSELGGEAPAPDEYQPGAEVEPGSETPEGGPEDVVVPGPGPEGPPPTPGRDEGIWPGPPGGEMPPGGGPPGPGYGEESPGGPDEASGDTTTESPGARMGGPDSSSGAPRKWAPPGGARRPRRGNAQPPEGGPTA